MAEAEDVLSDVARHATIHARHLWRRHRHDPNAPPTVQLIDVAQRLELLLEAIFNQHFVLRVAQPPPRRSFLRRIFRRGDLPVPRAALPATNDAALWLPRSLDITDHEAGTERFRLLALRLATRAQRGSASAAQLTTSVLERDVYTVLEAHASDAMLLERLPGVHAALRALAAHALQSRSDAALSRPQYQPVELLLRRILLQYQADAPVDDIAKQARQCSSPSDTLALARTVMKTLLDGVAPVRDWGDAAVVLDDWTGHYLPPKPDITIDARSGEYDDESDDTQRARSAKLDRRPTIRKPVEDEDDQDPGIWMIHSGAPTEHVEDPMGMQRPTDRDDQTPAEEFADSVSELAEARLVSTPERARDVLISDDPPEARAHDASDSIMPDVTRIQYPEWDFRVLGYRDPGATVHLIPPPLGPLQWVDDTLRRHHGLLWAIRRQFEMLRPQRTRRRRQMEGHDIDFDAYVEAVSDRRAGRTMPQALYQNDHHAQRDTAVMLLIDISGSTDSWLSADQRIIDVEREALLLVCTALESVGDPYSILAFSGEGPHGVTIQSIKGFHDRYSTEVGQRIAALEPDRYTRTGAALRHATTMLMQQPAQHRLLLLLSDGKPNDADQYEGRYGVEDMRQAVNEAKLQGIFPFCLTIDWQAANYLPAIFGAHHYALLPKSEHLPTIMLDWIRRLLAQ